MASSCMIFIYILFPYFLLQWSIPTPFFKFIIFKIVLVYISRLTVVSREAKKKQHARVSTGLRDHYSELFTPMAALKF